MIMKHTMQSSRSMDALAKADNYISDYSKVPGGGIGSYGCPPNGWVSACKALKINYRKKHHKQYRQFIIGFDPHDRVTVELAVKIAVMICKYYPYYYTKYAVHTNTDHIHIHFIVCNTCVTTGKQMSMSKSDLLRFKEYCSGILKSFGLSGIRSLRHALQESDVFDSSDNSFEIEDDLYFDAREVFQEPLSEITNATLTNNQTSYRIPFMSKGIRYHNRNYANHNDHYESRNSFHTRQSNNSQISTRDVINDQPMMPRQMDDIDDIDYDCDGPSFFDRDIPDKVDSDIIPVEERINPFIVLDSKTESERICPFVVIDSTSSNDEDERICPFIFDDE